MATQSSGPLAAWPRLDRTPYGLRHSLAKALVAFLVICLAGLSAFSAEYRIEPLGFLDGSYSKAEAINGSGRVVGYALTAPGPEHAFFWDGPALIDLGTLGGAASRAYDINNRNQSAGWAQNAAGQTRPVIWDDRVIRELPTLGGPTGSARAINDSGQAVGNAYLTSSIYHAALWHDGRVDDLGTLGGTYSIAYDINTQGRIAGAAAEASGTQWATLWIDGTPRKLDALPGATSSAARAINDQDQAILWNYGVAHAALWDDGSVIDLGTFGGSQSWAYGLNNLGQVVGWADLPSGIYHAFLWGDLNGNGGGDPGEMQDLGTLGGQFSSAYGINDSGVIVGYAQDALGRWEAVRWVPVPEPLSMLLLGTGLGAVLVVRARRRRRRRAGL